ncbi:NAD-dependent dihydropyrimidine dehydrogenase subunit PreT [Pelotomaculum schinkii]|uniref:NAD-dependent dihydropyrimidine dehydrogenase subunit PreT n=1 Tax=Pelotomaculum schinkii TaxID=78350 RepID=A0A4Y7R6Q2_9FIRM|nr:FAD-dependent oxidoreductase [Pelotomaculum schinkii]TEB04436.1 NAD-dependent dihydropyrimidine dehydrogenase subunit PreT [Pelotomaculum schinkii]
MIGGYSLARKKQQIAVIGGGLSGLSCAMELAGKGFNVTVFEKSGKLGGRLWDMDRDLLPEQVIKEDIRQIEENGVNIRLNSCIADLPDLNFDALYVATGICGNTFGLDMENGIIQYDPVSLASSHSGVFVGGSLLSKKLCSPIHSIAQGARAARSIERFVQNVSLTNGRENEETQHTRLYTNIKHEDRKPKVLPKEISSQYTEKEAIDEAGRCMQCECKECVKACDSLAHFGHYPKRHLRDICKTLTSLQGIRSKMIATRVINSCSLCGLCKELCPNDLDMGAICLESRRILVNNDTMPPAFYEFWLRDMLNANDEKICIFKNQPGTPTSKYLFFPGCQMGSSFPGYVEKTYKYLIECLDGGIGLAVACCGAPAEWSGRKELHQEHLKSFVNKWEEMGRPQVILACTTCQKMFSKYLPEVPVKSLWVIMEENKLPLNVKKGGSAPLHFMTLAQAGISRTFKKVNADY